ncbi:MAG: DUF5320 domain-containing protein [Draconibacterium sp.]|nr:DUF5320 domain-containing protein [Draconibacterium sp.]
MPGFNRTGPSGQGPMTGRRMGTCADNDYAENSGRFNAGRGFGRGFNGNRRMGLGMGFRHGFQNQFFGNMPDVSEKTIIENEINTLKNQLSLLEDRLSKTKDA